LLWKKKSSFLPHRVHLGDLFDDKFGVCG
jgi:hypothetical protein